MTFEIVVYGTPAPAGSKKAFAIRRQGIPTGQVAVSDDSKRSKPWKSEIRQAVGKAMAGVAPMEGPLSAAFTFYVRRPLGHYGTGKNTGKVRASAPMLPGVKPDVLKLTRAVEDAMSGCVYRDDAQLTTEVLRKRFGTPERVEIRISADAGVDAVDPAQEIAAATQRCLAI
jgi:Holliday junction resolvase RusA-like endonuclease